MKWAIDHYKNVSYDFQYTCSVLNSFNFFEFLEELGENDDLINFHYIQYPFWYNTINFDEAKDNTIKLFEEKLNTNTNKNENLGIDEINSSPPLSLNEEDDIFEYSFSFCKY
mgnify:CR=1 FL=1